MLVLYGTSVHVQPKRGHRSGHGNKELCLWAFRGVIIQVILSNIPDFTVLVSFLVSLLGGSGLTESTGHFQSDTRRVAKLPALPFPLGRTTLLFSLLEPLQRPSDMAFDGWMLSLAADLLFKGRMALDSLLRITEYLPWTLTLKNESNITVPFYLRQNCFYG